MITKNEFLKFIDRVEQTNKTINGLENALGGIPLFETGLTSLLDYADRIAFSLMEKDDYSFFDGFATDFWNLINNGESVFEVIGENGELCKTSLKSWEDFYDYYGSLHN